MIAVVDTSALVELFTVDASELDASLADRLGHVIPRSRSPAPSTGSVTAILVRDAAPVPR